MPLHRRCQHPVRRRDEPAVGPFLHEVAAVDDHGAFHVAGGDPVAVPGLHLQSRNFGDRQERNESVVRMGRNSELVLLRLDRRIPDIAGQPVGIGEHPVEIVRRQAQGPGIKRQQRSAEVLHGLVVGQHGRLEAGKQLRRRPLVGPGKPAPLADARMIIGPFPDDAVVLVQIVLGVVARIGGHVDGRFDGHVAGGPLIHLEFQLLVLRQGVQAAHLIHGGGDQIRRHPVTDDVIEPDLLLDPTEALRQFAGCFHVTGEKRRDIENRDFPGMGHRLSTGGAGAPCAGANRPASSRDSAHQK